MWYCIVGVLALVLSFINFFRPEVIKKLSAIGERRVVVVEDLIKARKLTGLFYLVAGATLFFLALGW